MKKYKDKHNVLTESINHSQDHLIPNIGLNIDYLDLLHDVQTHMLKSHLKGHRTKIDNEKIRQKISEQLTEDLVGKISYKNENMKLKVI